jgi:hypothetical protein
MVREVSKKALEKLTSKNPLLSNLMNSHIPSKAEKELSVLQKIAAMPGNRSIVPCSCFKLTVAIYNPWGLVPWKGQLGIC